MDAPEILTEVWDAATNAVCQTMQERRMCKCPSGQCLAAESEISQQDMEHALRQLRALAESQPAPAADEDYYTVSYDSEEKLAHRVSALAGSRIVPVADTGQAVAWLCRDVRHGEVRVSQDRVLVDMRIEGGPEDWVVIPLYTHPAPLDAERVREDERDRLYSIAALSDHPGEVAWNAGLFLQSVGGAMLPAERAALRQKAGS